MKLNTVILLLLPVSLLGMSFIAPAVGAVVPKCPVKIQGDMNGDGVCNVTDQVLFNAAWNLGNQKADWNFDCVVDVADIARFGQIIGPSLNSAHSVMDYNLDGSTDIADVVLYTQDWSAGSGKANISKHYGEQNDCATDIADLTIFMDWYTGGCQ